MAVNPRGERHWAAFVIGSALGVGVLIFGPLTGAGLNPARWLGPAVMSGELADVWAYILGPIVGAVAAALAYTAPVLDPQERAEQRPIDTLE
jgi:aquaporin NIP